MTFHALGGRIASSEGAPKLTLQPDKNLAIETAKNLPDWNAYPVD
jgi:hypothetical protein